MEKVNTTVKQYYRLTKPGLIYGNSLTVLGGYLYGAIIRPELLTLVAVLAGSGLIMASGCVINNIFDRSIDQKMKRTKKRPTATGEIRAKNAAVYATVLALVGFAVLAIFTNALTVLLGAIGLITYAGIYTYAKKRTVHATLIGTIPGATPPLAGYVAATGRIDASFWVIAAIMICWQMVHFYAISIFRESDYSAANVPVISVKKDILTTKLLMVMYVCGFVISLLLLAKIGYAGLLYLAIMMPLATWWLYVVFNGFWAENSIAWARKTFGVSLLILPILCISLGLNAWAP